MNQGLGRPQAICNENLVDLRFSSCSLFWYKNPWRQTFGRMATSSININYATCTCWFPGNLLPPPLEMNCRIMRLFKFGCLVFFGIHSTSWIESTTFFCKLQGHLTGFAQSPSTRSHLPAPNLRFFFCGQISFVCLPNQWYRLGSACPLRALFAHRGLTVDSIWSSVFEALLKPGEGFGRSICFSGFVGNVMGQSPTRKVIGRRHPKHIKLDFSSAQTGLDKVILKTRVILFGTFNRKFLQCTPLEKIPKSSCFCGFADVAKFQIKKTEKQHQK